MHYYRRNLGDYAKKAGRLSMLQHGAYTLLLDACYDRERFPTELEAIEWTWASTPEEEQAVRFVLSRFFELDEDGETYVQPRVQEELQAYKVGEIQNRLIALSREAKRRSQSDQAEAYDQLRAEIKHAPLSKTHEAWTSVVDALVKSHEAPPNQEPLTTNQEPITNIKNILSDADASNPPVEQNQSDEILNLDSDSTLDNSTGTPTCPSKQIIELYNEILPELPRVMKITDSRTQATRNRWKQDSEHQSLEFWRAFFHHVRKSDFLMGRTQKPFSCSYDWIMKQANFVKIYEGNYHQ